MLTVKQFKGSRVRSTEASFEKAFADELRKQGIYSRHMSDSVPGIPDRYLAGGRWIEFKSLFRKRGGFTLGEGLSVEQWRQGDALHAAGDKVFWCALLDTGEGDKSIAIFPWGAVRAWEGKLVSQWAENDNLYARGDLSILVGAWFRRG